MAESFRITHPTALVLVAVGQGSGYGFDVMEATGLPSGTVYPILRRLERAGALAASWEDPEISRDSGRPRRKNYTLTDSGREALAQARLKLAGPTGIIRAAAGSGESGGAS